MKSRIQRGTTIEGQLARRRNVSQRSEMLKKSNGSQDDVPFASSSSGRYFKQTTPIPGTHDLLVGVDLDPASDRGINFFFAHYVTISEGAFAGRLGPPTRPLWKELHISGIFRDAVSSIGLAGLANVEDDKGLMILARRKYSDILQQVMVALDGTSEADLLSTFRTVVLLAAFEVSISKNDLFLLPELILQDMHLAKTRFVGHPYQWRRSSPEKDWARGAQEGTNRPHAAAVCIRGTHPLYPIRRKVARVCN